MLATALLFVCVVLALVLMKGTLEEKGAGKLKDRVVGTWHTTVDDTYLVFNADGTGTAREGGGKEKDIRWLIRSGDLFILDTAMTKSVFFWN